ncbi:MAG: nicotinate-nucleotide adenylyltransferase [Gemmatimonadota bacterium]
MGQRPRKAGVFGGTYDPIHVGHLVTGIEALETLELDLLIFVPALRSPHKPDATLTPAEVRLDMVRGAVEGYPRLRVSDLELRRSAPSYTVDTLAEMATSEPDTEITLILGVDQWRAFGRWKEPREIVRLARIAVLTRDGERPSESLPELGDGPPPAFLEIPVTRLDVSSTLVRERVRARRSIRFLVPDPVGRIIEAKSLYR